jgi:DNA-binding LytR/AlgR family response regulator
MHLPELRGMDFMRSVTQCPPVIITTAYHQYALPSYEYNVVDYLLKPFDFVRFVKAVNKFFLQKNHAEMVTHGITERPFLLISVNKKKIKIFTCDIFYIESVRQYVKIFTVNGIVTTKLKISQVDGWLSNMGFMRIHRSFIVSRDNITSFTALQVEIKGKQIPIGRNYKQNTLNALKTGQVHNNPGIGALT